MERQLGRGNGALLARTVDDAAAGAEITRRELIDDRGGLRAIRIDALLGLAERTVAAWPLAAQRGDMGRLQLVLDTEFVGAVAAGEETIDGECTLNGARVARDVALRRRPRGDVFAAPSRWARLWGCAASTA